MDLVQIFNKIVDNKSSLSERREHLDLIVSGARRAYISFDDYILTSMTMGIKDVVRTQNFSKDLSELAMWCADLTSTYVDNLLNVYKKGGGLLDDEEIVLNKINQCFYNLELKLHMEQMGSEDEAAAASYLALNGLAKPK